MDDSLKDSWQPKGPISKKIRERIQKAGKRFHSNDNISEFIEDGEIDLLQAEVQEKLQGVLDSLVIDTEHDHNTQETYQTRNNGSQKVHSYFTCTTLFHYFHSKI